MQVRLGETVQRRWSEHLLFDITSMATENPPRVLVKCIRAQDRTGRRQSPLIAPDVRATAEYAALQTIQQIIAAHGVTGLSAIQPIACLPEYGALAMEYRPGRDLLALIGQAVRPFPARDALTLARESASRAGQWLGLVHRELSTMAQQTSEVDEYTAAIVDQITSLKDNLAPEMTAVLERAIGCIEPAAGFGGMRISTVPLHGDFYPDNIVVIPNGDVYVVDTMLRFRGPAEDDVAKFLVGVDTLKLRVLFDRLVVRPEPLESIKEAFLSGYRQMSSCSEWLLAIALIRACVVRWSELSSVAATRRPRPLAVGLKGRINRFMSGRLAALVANVSQATRLQ
jgi:hypothetical protein